MLKQFEVTLTELMYFPTVIVTAENEDEAEDFVRREWEDGMLSDVNGELKFETNEIKQKKEEQNNDK